MAVILRHCLCGQVAVITPEASPYSSADHFYGIPAFDAANHVDACGTWMLIQRWSPQKK